MIVENFREYLEQILREGYSVRHDEHGSDPDLIDPGGNPIETWCVDYPYDERMERDQYEDEKYALQIELLKFQGWAQETGTKHVILFEGRDAAGRGGTIKRSSVMEAMTTSAYQPGGRPLRAKSSVAYS
jgi:polyphosphate kinase 2 (PPK2 family)